MIPHFKLVDAGCLMFEHKKGRWIIEHPRNGYKPTISRQWDVIIEHPESPHTKPLKFLGSFSSKRASIEFVKKLLQQGFDYFNAFPIDSQFYYKDYSQK